MHNRTLLAVVVAVLSAALLSDAYSQSRQCIIKSMVGTVKIRRGASTAWTDARPRMPLREKDALRTFVESEAELETSEGSIIKISENSTLEMSTLQGDKDVQSTRVKILDGAILSNVKKLVNTKSRFEFETPTAVASIRGTVLGVDVSGDSTKIRVYEGRVLVVPQGAKEGKELSDNQMASVAKGQKTFDIVKLEEKQPADSAKVAPGDTSKTVADSAALQGKVTPADSVKTAADTVQPEALRLTVTSPLEGAVVGLSAQVVVSGTVVPPAAAVAVNGKPLAAAGTGNFKAIMVAPSKAGDYAISIVAEYKGQTQAISRRIMVAAARKLEISVSAPQDGAQYAKPLIQVNGLATPGAEVTVTPPGIRVPVLSGGSFSVSAPIPDEEGDHNIEIDASLDGAAQKIVRRIVYHPDFRFMILTPAERQTVSTIMLPIKGEVKPSKGAEVSVMGRKMPVALDGTWSGMVTIPDEEGEVQLEFEVTAGGRTQTVTRTITYKRPPDTYAPVIQATLPKFAKQRQLCLPVFDRTVGEEVTFYWEINGARESEMGSGNATFCLSLEPGVHKYAVWAVDKAGNQSQRLSETISYVETSGWYIKMRKPAGDEVIRLPPSPPQRDFNPAYPVEFSIENLPGDDMRLIREVKVTNQATGQAVTQSTFTDNYLEFEIGLKIGRSNALVIEVQDINSNRKVQQAVIHVR